MSKKGPQGGKTLASGVQTKKKESHAEHLARRMTE
jgi:hypothetical protein